MVCVSVSIHVCVGHVRQPCENCLTIQDAISGLSLHGGPKKPCIRRDADPKEKGLLKVGGDNGGPL